MKHEANVQFKTAQKEGDTPNMLEAIAAAKSAINSMTGQSVDSVVECTRQEENGWSVSIDVIESHARLGDNDLLATYQVEIGPNAELAGFSRLRRYHREDREG
ncbi:gas vesicle protein GvpO [Cognatiyoonia sp. IB215182]|uniref:gas vesicle protein GvpO n=1 Tax=Cognatiyoonia sp. IB215182 TaxID=3097353 RepID=UPI002A0E4640|nr:gas vesicle protein GvpO [Cognatiyoonia sp. IB215182]MDX8351426.1 gas vesicle protein GvpO [Cognatiyoonia sp. IB215182]